MVGRDGLAELFAEHAVFDGVSDAHRALIAGCAANVVVPAGGYVYREGQPADRFYLIRHGRVAVEVFVPGRSPIIVDTLKAGDLLGWSWLVPPYRHCFDARAIELTRLLSLDAACLRRKMEDDCALGYALHQCFATVVAARLAAARRQLIDMYGHPDAKARTWR